MSSFSAVAPASGATSRKIDPPATRIRFPDTETAGPPLGLGTSASLRTPAAFPTATADRMDPMGEDWATLMSKRSLTVLRFWSRTS